MLEAFVTGVGTAVGKTLVTTILGHQLTSKGRRVTAIKPVVSGYSTDDANSDPALILRSLGRTPTPEAIAAISPWRLAAPSSPHLAARRDGRAINLDEILEFCRAQEDGGGDLLLIEGAGGVMTPLDETHTGLDLIVGLGHPVILVTGSYLGALSHTLTALYALRGSGARVRALVVSGSEPSAGLVETVESLQQFGGVDLPIYALPRLSGGPEEKWRAAPSLTGLCDLEDG
jgi:dethiobiotin synthetase